MNDSSDTRHGLEHIPVLSKIANMVGDICLGFFGSSNIEYGNRRPIVPPTDLIYYMAAKEAAATDNEIGMRHDDGKEENSTKK
jgi:hypothetical protein